MIPETRCIENLINVFMLYITRYFPDYAIAEVHTSLPSLTKFRWHINLPLTLMIIVKYLLLLALL